MPRQFNPQQKPDRRKKWRVVMREGVGTVFFCRAHTRSEARALFKAQLKRAGGGEGRLPVGTVVEQCE